MKNSTVPFRLQFLLSLNKWMSLFSVLKEYGHVIPAMSSATPHELNMPHFQWHGFLDFI